jgi:hypothetical protein
MIPLLLMDNFTRSIRSAYNQNPIRYQFLPTDGVLRRQVSSRFVQLPRPTTICSSWFQKLAVEQVLVKQNRSVIAARVALMWLLIAKECHPRQPIKLPSHFHISTGSALLPGVISPLIYDRRYSSILSMQQYDCVACRLPQALGRCKTWPWQEVHCLR